jgi:hypothetical protein
MFALSEQAGQWFPAPDPGVITPPPRRPEPRHKPLTRRWASACRTASEASAGQQRGIGARLSPGSVTWMLLDEGFSGITDGDLRMRPTVVVHPRPYGLRVDPFHRV